MIMKPITSAENQIYKAAVQLKQKKYRDEQGKYLIEGPNLIYEALCNEAEIEMMIRSETFIPEGIDAPMAVLSPDLFRRLSDTETPQGIMAIAKKRLYSGDEFFSRKLPFSSNLIVLDRLQDPGNIGTILRTADAAGYMGAMILKGTADIFSPKIVRAAAGSLFRLPVLIVDSPCRVIQLLKKHEKKIICTAPSSSRFYYDIDMRENTAIIIGNEGNGVCDELSVHSEIQVKIPMEGSIESLNAAVSAGILMYESVRQRFQG